MTDKILCIYHGNCADGFAAAWIVRQALGEKNVEFYPGVYQTDPPDVAGHHVLLVDFSYKRSVLTAMAQKARSVVIIDHHKTAAEDLSGFREPAPFAEWSDAGAPMVEGDPEPIAALFDMSRSGAGMVWDFFYPTTHRPWLINHIEDRDLWRFKIPGTREIQAAVFSYPYDFAVWDEIMHMNIAALEEQGRTIERKHFKDIDELIKVSARTMIIGGYAVPVANLPYTMASDAGHKMAQGERFAATYIDTPDGRVFSLRSADDGMDVSEIAKQYGGGGHARAAGFKVPFSRIGEFE